MIYGIKVAYDSIKCNTKHVLTPTWTVYLVLYQILVGVICLYHEYQISNHDLFFYSILSYLGCQITFHLGFIFYSLLRSNVFFDADLFWVTTLGALIYYVV